MSNSRLIYAVLLFFLTISIQSGQAIAGSDYSWKFDTRDELKGWSGESAEFAFIEKDGILRLKGNMEPKIISPTGLNIPSDAANYLVLKFRAALSGPARGMVLLKPKGSEGFIYNPAASFYIKQDSLYHEYHVSMQNKQSRIDMLDQFAVVFMGGRMEIDMDSIALCVPSIIELIKYSLKNGLLNEQVIASTTINDVATPMIGARSIVTYLYVAAFILWLIVLFLKRSFSSDAIIKGAIISFVSIGFLFALRMDYNWLRIWIDDSRMFSGKGIGERVEMIDGSDIYNFINEVKKVIPPYGKIMMKAMVDVSDYFAVKGKYNLLPLRVHDDGEYLVVYRNPDIIFDPVSGSLSKSGKIIASHVETVYRYNNYGFVYKRIKR